MPVSVRKPIRANFNGNVDGFAFQAFLFVGLISPAIAFHACFGKKAHKG